MADVVNTIQGKLIGVGLSTNLVTPSYKDLVCGMTSELSGSADSTTVETRCGVFRSFGTPVWSVTGSGAVNTTPGGSEYSADELLGFFQNRTKLAIKIYYIVDDSLYTRESQGVIAQYRETARVKELLLFDFLIELTEAITI